MGSPMDLAALVRSQNFATLLAALDGAGLAAGRTVEARLVGTGPDGTATALVDGIKIALVLAGPEARQADLQPGARLLLRLDQAPGTDGHIQATLVGIRPAPGAPSDPASLPVSPASPGPGSPAQTAQAAAGTPHSLPSVAPNALPQPLATALTGPAVAGEPLPPAVAPASLIRPSGTAAPTLLAGNATGVARPAAAGATPTAAVMPTPVPTAPPSPRAIAGPLLADALRHQDSLAPLLANLAGLAGGTLALTLPKPLLGLIDQILAQRLPAEPRVMTAAALRGAVQRSGLFLEARQAMGELRTPQNDLKAGLQALRDLLQPLARQMAAAAPQLPAAPERPDIAPETVTARPAAATAPVLQPKLLPPGLSTPLQPQPAEQPSLEAGARPAAIVQTLSAQAEAALDRVALSQYASLPTEAARLDQQPQARWLTEIPLALPTGTAILPLEIEREAPRPGAIEPEAPLWRVRFALDTEPLGELQAIVTLQGRALGITFWAQREETSRLLRLSAPELEGALLRAQFDSAACEVFTGQPHHTQPAAGQFLDRRS